MESISTTCRANHIAFYKIEKDGFGLGAQRRPSGKSDLPAATTFLKKWCSNPKSAIENQQSEIPPAALIVEKSKLAENGEYNLSGERYRETILTNHQFPMVSLGDKEIFKIESGGTPKSKEESYWNGEIQWATLADLPAENFISEIRKTKRNITEQGLQKSSAKLLPKNSVLVSTRATIGRIVINKVPLATNQGFKNIVILDHEKANSAYIAFAVSKLVPTMQAWATGGTFAELSKTKFCELEIPIHPDWPMVKLENIIEGKPKNGYSEKPVQHETNLKVLTLSAKHRATQNGALRHFTPDKGTT